MSFGNNNGNNNNAPADRPQGKPDVFNKVSFSSVKMGQTKQGSPTVGLYLKREQAEKLHALLGELLNAGEDGCKLSCIVIPGKDYNSGYTYVNPKEARQAQGNNGSQAARPQGNGNSGFGPRQNRGAAGNANNKSSARAFFESKRVNDGTEGSSGN